jgi:nitrate reductase beta subunit
MDGTGLRFETMEHGGEYPDTMPQAIKLIDAMRVRCRSWRNCLTSRAAIPADSETSMSNNEKCKYCFGTTQKGGNDACQMGRKATAISALS